MSDSVIYLIVNLITEMYYVGSAINFTKRRKEHRVLLRANSHSNIKLQHAWNKHGGENFKFYVIDYVPKEGLLEREQFWLNKLRATERDIGYNINPTAGSNLGRKWSEEVRAKISKSVKGRKFTEEHKLKISNANKGKKRTPEMIKSMSDRALLQHKNKGRFF